MREADDILHPDTLTPAPDGEVFAGTLQKLRTDLANLHKAHCLQSYAGLAVSEGPPCVVDSVGDLIDQNFKVTTPFLILKRTQHVAPMLVQGNGPKR